MTTKAKPTKKATSKPKGTKTGLVGMFGHTHVFNEDQDRNVIHWQFMIFRKIDAGRYLVQLFSWIDGSPTLLKPMSESELLGENVTLYATDELMNIAYEKECEKHPWRSKLRAVE